MALMSSGETAVNGSHSCLSFGRGYFFVAVLGFLELTIEFDYLFLDVFWVFFVDHCSFEEFGDLCHFGLFHAASGDFVCAYSNDTVGDDVCFLESFGDFSSLFVVSVVYDRLV